MSDLTTKYVSQAGGDKSRACELMARDLMRGDPASFKAGYTAGNAAHAAVEAFLRIENHSIWDSEEREIVKRLEAWEEGRNDPAVAAALAERLSDAGRALRREARNRRDIAEAKPDGMSADLAEDQRERASELESLAEQLGA